MGLAGLVLDELHHTVDLLRGDEAALDTGGLGVAQREVEHIALAHQLLRAGGVQNDAGLHGAGHGEGDAAGDIGLHQTGDHVRRGTLGGDDQVHTGGTAHLGHTADGLLHLLGRHQHQVGQLVDEHHHGGQLFHVLVRLRQGVIARQVLDALFREHLVALHHLEHRPLQGAGGLFGVGDHGDEQVRDTVVGRQLHHLGVHHDKTDLVRRGLVEQADDEGVGADGFTGAGGAGDEYMGQTGDVAHDVAAADIPAHGKGHRGGMVDELAGFNDIADPHGGDGAVGDLDAHGGYLVGHRGDADAAGTQRQGDIVLEVRDLTELDALVQGELVAGDGGAMDDLAGAGVHAEGAQGVRQALGVVPQLGAHLGVVAAAVLLQQGDGRVAVSLLPLGQLLLDGIADLLGGALHLLLQLGFFLLVAEGLLRGRGLRRSGGRCRFVAEGRGRPAAPDPACGYRRCGGGRRSWRAEGPCRHARCPAGCRYWGACGPWQVFLPGREQRWG